MCLHHSFASHQPFSQTSYKLTHPDTHEWRPCHQFHYHRHRQHHACRPPNRQHQPKRQQHSTMIHRTFQSKVSINHKAQLITHTFSVLTCMCQRSDSRYFRLARRHTCTACSTRLFIKQQHRPAFNLFLRLLLLLTQKHTTTKTTKTEMLTTATSIKSSQITTTTTMTI